MPVTFKFLDFALFSHLLADLCNILIDRVVSILSESETEKFMLFKLNIVQKNRLRNAF